MPQLMPPIIQAGFLKIAIDFLTDSPFLLHRLLRPWLPDVLRETCWKTYIGPRTGRRILEGQIQRGRR